MNEPENLIRVGKAVLTPQAIEFIEMLQYESNESVHSYSKMLSELIAGTLLFVTQGAITDAIAKRLTANASELCNLALEIEALSKP